MINHRSCMSLLILGVSLSLLAGCNFSPAPPASPTAAVTPSPTQTPLPPSQTAMFTDAPSPMPIVATDPPTITPLPTKTLTASPTPNPYATYIIQANDTLLYIIQQAPFFYRDGSVVNEIIRINPNVPSPNQLPPPGSSILIPLPTPTPTLFGQDLTQTAQPNQPDVVIAGIAQVSQVEVREGITILGIAGQYNTNLPILATLNPQLFFVNCDFANPSGGPDCNVSMRIGDLVNVPAPSPTPTLSATFSGLETATPLPTYAPPVAIFPPNESSAPGRSFPLQWSSSGILRANEVYLIEINDETAGTQFVDITRATTFNLPESLIPTDGQTHTIRWRVTVAAPNDQGAYRFVSAQPSFRTFYWQSR